MMPLLNAMTAAAQEVQRNVKVGYGMQEDFPLSAFQDTVLNVMWMKPRGPIDKTVDTEDH